MGACIVHEADCVGCAYERLAESAKEDLQYWKQQDIQSLEQELGFLQDRVKAQTNQIQKLQDEAREMRQLLGITFQSGPCESCEGLGQDDDLSNMDECAACGGDGTELHMVRKPVEGAE